MPKHFDRHVLKNWTGDRLPVCAAPTCGRTIGNGDPYAVLIGTVKLVCLSCALDPFMRDAVLTEMTAQAVAREREARDRRVALAASRERKSRVTRRKSRRVVVRPKKPPAPRPRTARYRYPPHPCRWCGVVFQPKATRVSQDGVRLRGPQPYCSVACSVRGRRTEQQLRVCPACDQVFAPKQGSHRRLQTCCSRACARWWFPRGLKNPHPRPVLWSRSWGTSCRACGKSDRRHKGQGYCVGCYRHHRVQGVERVREPRAPDRTWQERMRRRQYVQASTSGRAEAATIAAAN